MPSAKTLSRHWNTRLGGVTPVNAFESEKSTAIQIALQEAIKMHVLL
jgi:hypothetical protein